MSPLQQIYGNPNLPAGRINRKEYLWRLFLMGTLYALSNQFAKDYLRRGDVLGFLFIAFALLMLLRLVMAHIKRLHDIGWSGCIVVFCIIPGLWKYYQFYEYYLHLRPKHLLSNTFIYMLAELAEIILIAILLFFKGQKGPNKYGKDPLMEIEGNKQENPSN